jgi:hypothetical protein
MNDPADATSRRRFLKLTGATMALIPLVHLYGCAEEEPEQPAQETGEPAAPATQPPPSEPRNQPPGPATQSAQPPPAQGAALVKLAESDPQAMALGYKHAAGDVDQSAFPRYEQGQLCSNCTLYQRQAGEEEWGGCQIFPGKLVNANGWCSAYVPLG